MFDFSKNYANRKGLVAALRKADIDLETVTIQQDGTSARWYADAFEMAKDELAAQEGRPSNVTFDLTNNELHAALVLVKNDCLDGMGGERPNDLDNDPYTWVYADTLVKFGWSKEAAAGTFASLDEKGVIYADGKESTINTAGYHFLDTVWDEHKDLATTRKVYDDPKPVAPVAVPAEKKGRVKSEKVNGVRFPKEGGLCWKAWMMFDELYKANNAFTVKDALAEGAKRDFNDNNVRTELCVWRKYHGVAARPAKG